MSGPPRKRVRYPLSTALRLTALHRELNAQMKIRITEPVFFLGAERKVGDVLDNVEVGPYRTELSHTTPPGGLTRIPQFVEMPEEIKRTIVEAAAPVSQVAPALAPSPVPPKPTSAQVAAPVAPKANPLAARIRALATRRAKFNDMAAAILTGAENDMTEVETNGPAVLKRAAAASNDELTAIADLGAALKELDASNGAPLES